MRAIALLILTGCGSPPPVEADPFTGSWIEAVVRDPSRFAALTEGARDGWIAWHRHDLDAAVAAFGPTTPLASRVRAERAAQDDDLAALAFEAATGLALSFSGLPEDDPRAHLADLLTCDPARAPEWARERAALWTATAPGSTDALRAALSTPIFVDGDRIVRDPCALRRLADADRVEAPPAGDGLETRFFGALPVSAPPPTTVADARAWLASFDAELEAHQRALAADAPDDGLALAAELDLYARARQMTVLARARGALAEGHPDVAAALAESAWDATSREIGVKNAPGLASVRALAALRLGRAREGLDALQPLADVDVEAALAREWLADRAVLDSLTRAGDSREE
jgi:hypothetical protein